MEIGTPERVEAIGGIDYAPDTQDKIYIPTYDDIKALDVSITVVIDTIGDEADDQPFAPLGLLANLTVQGDSHKNIVQARGIHLPGIHTQFYNSPAPIVAPDANDQVIVFSARIPIGVFRHQYRDLVASVQFGNDDDVNTNAGFAIDTASVEFSAIYGKVVEGYRIHYTEDTATNFEFRLASRGILCGYSLVDHDGNETNLSNATIELEHEGQDLIDSTWNKLKAAESIQTQQAHITGILNVIHNLITVKDNTYLYVGAQGSKTIDLVCYYVEQIKPVVKAGRQMVEGRITNLTTPQGRLYAFGTSGAKALTDGTVPRGQVYSTVSAPMKANIGTVQ